ncbi:MAG: hypothetical protein MSA15_02110 [Clostridium sp.]|nr:hypothetical protein [Clostridium sp.]
MNKIYKFNKEWLDLMLENKDNENANFMLSDNDTRILLTYIEVLQQENARLKDKIEKATNFVDKYMEEWDFQDEVRKDMNDLLILLKEN